MFPTWAEMVDQRDAATDEEKYDRRAQEADHGFLPAIEQGYDRTTGTPPIAAMKTTADKVNAATVQRPNFGHRF